MKYQVGSTKGQFAIDVLYEQYDKATPEIKRFDVTFTDGKEIKPIRIACKLLDCKILIEKEVIGDADYDTFIIEIVSLDGASPSMTSQKF